MIGKFVKKTKEKKGASIVAALFVLLACSIVAVIVIGAASAGAGRISKASDRENVYSLTAGAAKTISEDLSLLGLSYDIESKTMEIDRDPEGLVKLITDKIRTNMAPLENPSTQTSEFTISTTDLNNKSVSIHGSYEIDPSYNITITLDKVTTDGIERAESAYITTLKCKATRVVRTNKRLEINYSSVYAGDIDD